MAFKFLAGLAASFLLVSCVSDDVNGDHLGSDSNRSAAVPITESADNPAPQMVIGTGCTGACDRELRNAYASCVRNTPPSSVALRVCQSAARDRWAACKTSCRNESEIEMKSTTQLMAHSGATGSSKNMEESNRPLWCVERQSGDTYSVRFRERTQARTLACNQNGDLGAHVDSTASGNYTHTIILNENAVVAINNGGWQIIANNCPGRNPELINCPAPTTSSTSQTPSRLTGFAEDRGVGWYTFDTNNSCQRSSRNTDRIDDVDRQVRNTTRRGQDRAWRVCVPGADNLAGICAHIGRSCTTIRDHEGNPQGCGTSDGRDRSRAVRCE